MGDKSILRSWRRASLRGRTPAGTRAACSRRRRRRDRRCEGGLGRHAAVAIAGASGLVLGAVAIAVAVASFVILAAGLHPGASLSRRPEAKELERLSRKHVPRACVDTPLWECGARQLPRRFGYRRGAPGISHRRPPPQEQREEVQRRLLEWREERFPGLEGARHFVRSGAGLQEPGFSDHVAAVVEGVVQRTGCRGRARWNGELGRRPGLGRVEGGKGSECSSAFASVL